MSVCCYKEGNYFVSRRCTRYVSELASTVRAGKIARNQGKSRRHGLVSGRSDYTSGCLLDRNIYLGYLFTTWVTVPTNVFNMVQTYQSPVKVYKYSFELVMAVSNFIYRAVNVET